MARVISVDIPSGYTHRDTYIDGRVVDTIYPVAGHDLFWESRPDPDVNPKPHGWLYPKAYTVTALSQRAVKGHLRFVDSRYYNAVEWSGTLPISLSGLTPPPSNDDMRRRVETKALLKLQNFKNGEGKVNVGVALVEAQKTADFFGDTCHTLARSAVFALEGRYKRALKELGANWRDYPKGWIGWQYAAKPLMMDVQGMAEAVASSALNEVGGWVVTVKASGKESWVDEVSIRNHSYDSLLSTVTSTVGYFCRLDFITSNDALAAASRLGLLNAPVVLWEEIPYSFVIDWALPIGEWLETLTATLGFEFLSGSTTERLESIRKLKRDNQYVSGVGPESYIIACTGEYSGSSRAFYLHRTPLGAPPIYLKPRVKNPLSLGHMANGLSLLTQIFSRGKR